jgi:peptidoglycan L-alanyl-D-glutamate endopeptidase CwlK
MSAGVLAPLGTRLIAPVAVPARLSAPVPSNDLDRLAPKFRAAVEQALVFCKQDGLDAVVYEAYRSDELQALYFARGRTQVPPTDTVTNASSNLFSWHGYGLAVDVIHAKQHWDAPRAWFETVARWFRQCGCRWGGEWTKPDLPHFQWGLCKPSPSHVARELIASGGVQAVWDAVGASEEA